MLALSMFLCPNTRGVMSRKFYSSIANVSSVHFYDWCSYVLDNLVSHIIKFKKGKLMEMKKTLVVVAYC
uniref:Uncharacterized protein n=1 Tax=Arundo donax TaxID=35708 RepID=A0A0A9CTV4_ARUDO